MVKNTFSALGFQKKFWVALAPLPKPPHRSPMRLWLRDSFSDRRGVVYLVIEVFDSRACTASRGNGSRPRTDARDDRWMADVHVLDNAAKTEQMKTIGLDSMHTISTGQCWFRWTLSAVLRDGYVYVSLSFSGRLLSLYPLEVVVSRASSQEHSSDCSSTECRRLVKELIRWAGARLM